MVSQVQQVEGAWGKSKYQDLEQNLTKKLWSRSKQEVRKGVEYYLSQTKTLYKVHLGKPIIESAVTSTLALEVKGLVMR